MTFVEVDPRAHDDTSVMQTCCKLMHFRSDPVRRKNRKALLNKRRSTSQSPKGKKSMRKNGSSGTDSETERRFKGRRRRMSSMIRPKGPRAGDRPGQESSKIGDKHGNVPTDGWVEVMWVEVMFARFLFCLPGSCFVCQVLVLFARFLFCLPGSYFVCQVLVLFARFSFCFPGSCFVCLVLVLFARFSFCLPGSCFVFQVLVLFARFLFCLLLLCNYYCTLLWIFCITSLCKCVRITLVLLKHKEID